MKGRTPNRPAFLFCDDAREFSRRDDPISSIRVLIIVGPWIGTLAALDFRGPGDQIILPQQIFLEIFGGERIVFPTEKFQPGGIAAL